MASKQNTVSKKAFVKWSNNNDFDFEADNNNDLTLLKCKTCAADLTKIRREARKRNIHGPLLDSSLKYTEGVQYIHKANFDKYLRQDSFMTGLRRHSRKIKINQ